MTAESYYENIRVFPPKLGTIPYLTNFNDSVLSKMLMCCTQLNFENYLQMHTDLGQNFVIALYATGIVFYTRVFHKKRCICL